MRGRKSADAAIDLGLAVSGSRLELAPEKTMRIGVPRSLGEIAAFCGVSKGTVLRIEQKALRKLRRRIETSRDPLVRCLVEERFKR